MLLDKDISFEGRKQTASLHDSPKMVKFERRGVPSPGHQEENVRVIRKTELRTEQNNKRQVLRGLSLYIDANHALCYTAIIDGRKNRENGKPYSSR